MLEKIFHSFALFFNNQRDTPLGHAIPSMYTTCTLWIPWKNILDTLRQVHCRSVVITNLQSSHTTAHNLLNYFSPEVTYSLQVVFQFVQKVRENSHTLIFIAPSCKTDCKSNFCYCFGLFLCFYCSLYDIASFYNLVYGIRVFMGKSY